MYLSYYMGLTAGACSTGCMVYHEITLLFSTDLLRRGSGGTLGSALSSVSGRADGLSSLLLGSGSGGLALLGSLSRSRAAGTNGTKDEQDGSKQDSAQTAGDFGDGLDGLNWVLLGEADEKVDLLTNIGNGVFLEGNAGLGFLLRLGLGGLLLGNFNSLLDNVGLLAESSSVFNRVANVDVVKEDLVLHSPELESNL